MSTKFNTNYNLNHWNLDLITKTILFYFTNKGQVKYPRCCNKDPVYLITYDCGPDPNETILVCKDHYMEEAFQRFAIKIEKLQE
jgi:hypothetical protein